LSDDDKNYFMSIVKKNADDVDFTSSLRKLSHLLSLFYKKRVIILLDEYDAPIECDRVNEFYQDSISFFRPFYGEALKGNDDLRFAVVTGVLQVAKESLFSGLNNLLVNSITGSGFDQYFGFTEKETNDLLSYYGKGDRVLEAKTWYGGYRFGETAMFNPWSILSFARFGVLEPYWTNTGENSVLGELIGKSDERTLSSLNEVLSGGTVFVNVDTSINYREMSFTKDALFSFLVATGYLSCIERVDGTTFKVALPNKEVDEAFEREIKTRFIPLEKNDYYFSLRDAFLSGDSKRLSKCVEYVILSSFSSFDFSDEKNYQVLALTMSAIFFDECIVKSAVNEGNGRCDIMISPKNEGGIGSVIEIKHYKSKTSTTRLELESKKALAQIKERDYVEELKARKASKIFLYGMAFSQKNVAITSEIKN
jgi:hypothetical protein